MHRWSTICSAPLLRCCLFVELLLCTTTSFTSGIRSAATSSSRKPCASRNATPARTLTRRLTSSAERGAPGGSQRRCKKSKRTSKTIMRYVVVGSASVGPVSCGEQKHMRMFRNPSSRYSRKGVLECVIVGTLMMIAFLPLCFLIL